MRKPVRLTPRRDGNSWRISIPPKLSPTGKRQNLLFRTQALANAAAEKLRSQKEEFGNQAKAISPTLADQATAASVLLKPLGISILDAAQQYFAVSNLLAPFGISPIEAAQRVATTERENRASESIESALSKFQTAKESKSPKYRSAVKHMAAHLTEDFAGRQLSTITRAEIEAHCKNRTSGPCAFNARLRLLVTFWRWSAVPPRQWCKVDTISHIDRREPPLNAIEILSSKQVAKLLTTAEQFFPDTVIPFVIAIFTGMRQAEIERLQPEDFTEEGIEVPAINDKKNNRRRFIETPAPLASR